MASRVWCWCAYHLFMWLPLDTRLSWWLLPYAGGHAYPNPETPND